MVTRFGSVPRTVLLAGATLLVLALAASGCKKGGGYSAGDTTSGASRLLGPGPLDAGHAAAPATRAAGHPQAMKTAEAAR